MNRLIAYISLFVVLSLACSTSTPISSVPLQEVPSGSVLYQDDFSNRGSGWDILVNDAGIMDYDGGGYRILVNGNNINFWTTPHKDFPNVRMEVDVGKLAGPDENRIGLLCRFTGKEYYFFMISSDGYYGIGIFAEGQAILLGQSEMKPSDNIQKGMAVNHLRADCTGDMLTFYVNGFQVTSVQDGTLKSGDVGMLAGTFNQAGADIVFDNFVVLKP